MTNKDTVPLKPQRRCSSHIDELDFVKEFPIVTATELKRETTEYSIISAITNDSCFNDSSKDLVGFNLTSIDLYGFEYPPNSLNENSFLGVSDKDMVQLSSNHDSYYQKSHGVPFHSDNYFTFHKGSQCPLDNDYQIPLLLAEINAVNKLGMKNCADNMSENEVQIKTSLSRLVEVGSSRFRIPSPVHSIDVETRSNNSCSSNKQPSLLDDHLQKLIPYKPFSLERPPKLPKRQATLT